VPNERLTRAARWIYWHFAGPDAGGDGSGRRGRWLRGCSWELKAVSRDRRRRQQMKRWCAVLALRILWRVQMTWAARYASSVPKWCRRAGRRGAIGRAVLGAVERRRQDRRGAGVRGRAERGISIDPCASATTRAINPRCRAWPTCVARQAHAAGCRNVRSRTLAEAHARMRRRRQKIAAAGESLCVTLLACARRSVLLEPFRQPAA